MNLRAGLVGLGVMGKHHARVLASLDGVELVSIVDPLFAGQEVSGRRVAGDVRELLDLGLDYCVIASPTDLHEELGVRLASHGVSALLEKPLAHTASAAETLVQSFEAAGLVAGVGHIERYNPALLEARARIRQGQLGRILQVVTRRQGPFPARISDVGVVKDLGTHDLDLTSWITGQRYSSVSAEVSCTTGRPHEDLVVVVASLEAGVIVSHVVNWMSPFKERTIVITGEHGAFVADTLTADLTFYANGVLDTEWDEIASFRGVREGDVVRYAIAKPEPLRTEHENFRDAVLGKEAEVVSLRDGLQAVQVSEAILTSAQSGSVVHLEPGTT